MKIICISDTHGFHDKIELPEGDIIIHAGDISGMGRPHEIKLFLDWFSNLNFKYKIFVAGNHDFYFDNDKFKLNEIPENVIYLNDSGIEIKGIKIWGSPITPWFYDWAFNRHRGEDIRKHWEMIPLDTDILITHGPPQNILDRTYSGVHAGCEDLLDMLVDIKPKFHIFGHIHEGYGLYKRNNGTTYINASTCTLQYKPINKPIVIEDMKLVYTV